MWHIWIVSRVIIYDHLKWMFTMDGQHQCLNNKRIFISKKFTMLHDGFWYCQVTPSQVIGIWWHGIFQHLKSLFWNYLNLKHVTNNVWVFDNCNYGQRMNMYMLTIYIIHGPFGDIMLSHDLWLKVVCDFTYAIKLNLVVNVSCNCFIITNWYFSFTVVGFGFYECWVVT